MEEEDDYDDYYEQDSYDDEEEGFSIPQLSMKDAMANMVKYEMKNIDSIDFSDEDAEIPDPFGAKTSKTPDITDSQVDKKDWELGQVSRRPKNIPERQISDKENDEPFEGYDDGQKKKRVVQNFEQLVNLRNASAANRKPERRVGQINAAEIFAAKQFDRKAPFKDASLFGVFSTVDKMKAILDKCNDKGGPGKTERRRKLDPSIAKQFEGTKQSQLVNAKGKPMSISNNIKDVSKAFYMDKKDDKDGKPAPRKMTSGFDEIWQLKQREMKNFLLFLKGNEHLLPKEMMPSINYLMNIEVEENKPKRISDMEIKQYNDLITELKTYIQGMATRQGERDFKDEVKNYLQLFEAKNLSGPKYESVRNKLNENFGKKLQKSKIQPNPGLNKAKQQMKKKDPLCNQLESMYKKKVDVRKKADKITISPMINPSMLETGSTLHNPTLSMSGQKVFFAKLKQVLDLHKFLRIHNSPLAGSLRDHKEMMNEARVNVRATAQKAESFLNAIIAFMNKPNQKEEDYQLKFNITIYLDLLQKCEESEADGLPAAEDYAKDEAKEIQPKKPGNPMRQSLFKELEFNVNDKLGNKGRGNQPRKPWVRPPPPPPYQEEKPLNKSGWSYKKKTGIITSNQDNDDDSKSAKLSNEFFNNPVFKKYNTNPEPMNDPSTVKDVKNIISLMKAERNRGAVQDAKNAFESGGEEPKYTHGNDYYLEEAPVQKGLCANVRNMFETKFRDPGLSNVGLQRSKSCASLRRPRIEPIPEPVVPKPTTITSKIRQALKPDGGNKKKTWADLFPDGDDIPVEPVDEYEQFSSQFSSQFNVPSEEKSHVRSSELRNMFEQGQTCNEPSESRKQHVPVARSSSFNKFRDAFESGKAEVLQPAEGDEAKKPSAGIKAELESIKNSTNLRNLLRINKPKNELVRSQTMSNIDLDDYTKWQVGQNKSDILRKFENYEPKVQYGSGNKKPALKGSQQSKERNRPVTITKNKEQINNRKWVFDTINQYFDVIKEDEEENDDESTSYVSSNNNRLSPPDESSNKLKDMLNTIASSGRGNISIDKFKTNLGSHLAMGSNSDSADGSPSESTNKINDNNDNQANRYSVNFDPGVNDSDEEEETSSDDDDDLEPVVINQPRVTIVK